MLYDDIDHEQAFKKRPTQTCQRLGYMLVDPLYNFSAGKLWSEQQHKYW